MSDLDYKLSNDKKKKRFSNTVKQFTYCEVKTNVQVMAFITHAASVMVRATPL